MTHPQRSHPDPADSSVIRTVRGIPSWAAILLAIIFGAIGMVVGHQDSGYTVGWRMGVIFIAGCALATLAVRRGSIFTAMVQPPIVLALLVLVTFRFVASERIFAAGTRLVEAFPVMAVATGIAVLLGLVRVISQPIRTPRRTVPSPDLPPR